MVFWDCKSSWYLFLYSCSRSGLRKLNVIWLIGGR
jgi:hypothetical protein